MRSLTAYLDRFSPNVTESPPTATHITTMDKPLKISARSTRSIKALKGFKKLGTSKYANSLTQFSWGLNWELANELANAELLIAGPPSHKIPLLMDYHAERLGVELKEIHSIWMALNRALECDPSTRRGAIAVAESGTYLAIELPSNAVFIWRFTQTSFITLERVFVYQPEPNALIGDEPPDWRHWSNSLQRRQRDVSARPMDISDSAIANRLTSSLEQILLSLNLDRFDAITDAATVMELVMLYIKAVLENRES